MPPTREQIDEYIASIEAYVSTSFASVAPDIHSINDSINQLWREVTRFGPPEMPDLRLPGLGRFEVPAPPPPPPPPMPAPPASLCRSAVRFVGRNKKLAGVLCVGAIGAGLLVGYSASAFVQGRARGARRAVGASSTARRCIVVVLGGDTPLGPALIQGLEKEGYIVITSVSNPDAIADIEANGNGYVRALVFDPKEPSTLQPFLRSLKATLTLRFPLNSAGDPYQHSSLTFPVLHSIVCLLTLPPASSPPPAPLEHLGLTSTYESYLKETHIMPLQAIQALLPLFRIDSVRSQDANYVVGGKKSVVICVPAADARVGVPYAAAQAMSAAATVRGAEVMRRELAQLEAQNVMRDVRVVLVDVGAVGKSDTRRSRSAGGDVWIETISEWTPSEQKIYGDAYAAYVSAASRGRKRKPTSVNRFVRSIVSTVGRNAAKGEGKYTYLVGLRLWVFGLHEKLRGDRILVGAGAATYAIASYLPSFILDALLNLPAILVSIRNKYLPIQPYVQRPPSKSPPAPPNVSSQENLIELEAEAEKSEPSESPSAASAAPIAVAQTESGSSTQSNVWSDHRSPAASAPGVDSSWISVQDDY